MQKYRVYDILTLSGYICLSFYAIPTYYIAERELIIMENNQENKSKKKTPKQIAAMGAVVLLVLMYIVTFIAAFVFPASAGNLFMLCVFGTIAVPFLLWIYIWLFQKMTHREEADVEENNETQ